MSVFTPRLLVAIKLNLIAAAAVDFHSIVARSHVNIEGLLNGTQLSHSEYRREHYFRINCRIGRTTMTENLE